jgi:16S rRNA (cytidine1402-2'-O)-methyltransferase
MEDISARALKTLADVDYILSEDTRETSKLLNYFKIEKPQISYRDQNHDRVLSQIKDLIENGLNIALVSDRGTPLISDPGYKLVRDLIKEGVKIESIPGPSSVIDALVLSGLPTDKFIFLGFLPKGKAQVAKLLEKFGEMPATLIIFESPYRLESLLETASEVLGSRDVAVCKELTKMHEEIYRFYLPQWRMQKFDLRGEFVVVISKKDKGDDFILYE